MKTTTRTNGSSVDNSGTPDPVDNPSIESRLAALEGRVTDLESAHTDLDDRLEKVNRPNRVKAAGSVVDPPQQFGANRPHRRRDRQRREVEATAQQTEQRRAQAASPSAESVDLGADRARSRR